MNVVIAESRSKRLSRPIGQPRARRVRAPTWESCCHGSVWWARRRRAPKAARCHPLPCAATAGVVAPS